MGGLILASFAALFVAPVAAQTEPPAEEPPVFTLISPSSIQNNGTIIMTAGAIGPGYLLLFEVGGATMITTDGLPAGLTASLTYDDATMEYDTIAIEGFPSVAGDFVVTVSAANSAGTTTTTFSIEAGFTPAITGPDPVTATATEGVPFSYQIVATNSTGGFSLEAPSVLPAGFSLNGATGEISGVPTFTADPPGAYPVGIKATNVFGSSSIEVTIIIPAVDPATLLNEDPGTLTGPLLGEPVDTGTGAETVSRTLIGLTGLRGLDFTINYNSAQANEAIDIGPTLGIVLTNGGAAGVLDVGKGWSHEYLAEAEPGTDSNGNPVVVIAWSQYHANSYSLVASGSGLNGGSGARYRSAAQSAEYDTLTETSSSGFILTKRDGTTYTFTASGSNGYAYLSQVANRFGQVLEVNDAIPGTQLSSIVEPVSGAALNFTYTNGKITKINDSAGRSVSMIYDSAGDLTGIVDVNGNTTTYSYSILHYLTTVTTPDEATVVTNTYDSWGRVLTQHDGIPSHAPATFAYNEVGQPANLVTTAVDHDGASTTYVHDPNLNLLSFTDPIGNVTTYSYDSFGNLTTKTDALARTSTFTYDANGNLLTSVDAAGDTTTFTYDGNRNLLSVTNAAGNVSTFTYDSQNNPLQLTDFAGNKTTRTYGANSQLRQVTTPRGNITIYGYTGGRLTSVTDPYSNKTILAYDAAGRLTSSTDPTGATSTFTYNASNKILERIDPAGDTTTFAYDVRDRLITATDPVGGVTTWSYDANNNLLSLTNSLNGVRNYAYDGENRLITATDPLGNATTNAYDSDGRLTSTTDPLGNSVRFVFDAVGNRTAVYDALGNEILQVTYDNRNLPITATDALGRKTASAYDALKRLSQMTDPLGNINAYGYDPRNLLNQATDPLGLVSTQSYDGDGNRTAVVNPLNAALSFAYDNDDRLATLTTAGGRTTTYSYDPRSLLAKIVDPTGNSTSRTFDPAGRLSKSVDVLSEIDYAYDAKSRLLTVTENGKPISRVYDALDRLTKFTDATGNALQYAYDANNNLTALTYPDGKVVTYAYDADNRLTTVDDWLGRGTTYSYDANSRLIKTIRPNNTVQSRAYDVAGQLTNLTDLASDGSIIVQYTYTYDAGGELTSEARSPVIPSFSLSTLMLGYNADNQLTTYGSQGISYNPNGDALTTPLSGILSSLTYDARDRLTAAGGISYVYDAENRRLQSTSSAGATTYVVNPNAPLSQLLVSVDPSGNTTRNVYGLGLLYQDTNGAIVRYLHGDFRGSTVALTEAAGTVTGRIEYGPFGEISSESGDTTTSFEYVGQMGVETDSNALIYMRARHYNPQARSFLQQDINLGTIAGSGALNRYAYASNNPTNRTDVTGLSPQSVSADFGGPINSVNGTTVNMPYVNNGMGQGPQITTLIAKMSLDPINKQLEEESIHDVLEAGALVPGPIGDAAAMAQISEGPRSAATAIPGLILSVIAGGGLPGVAAGVVYSGLMELPDFPPWNDNIGGPQGGGYNGPVVSGGGTPSGYPPGGTGTAITPPDNPNLGPVSPSWNDPFQIWQPPSDLAGASCQQ